MEKIATTSCGCCVIRYVDGTPQILLVRPFPDRDAWGIPKGHVDEGETFEQCALRETKEEAGIDVVLLDALNTVQVNYRHEKKTVRAFLAYQADKTQIPAALDGENVDIRFFGFDELPTIHVYQRPLVAEAASKVTEFGQAKFDLDFKGDEIDE